MQGCQGRELRSEACCVVGEFYLAEEGPFIKPLRVAFL